MYQILVEGVARVGKDTFIQHWIASHPEYEYKNFGRGTTEPQFYDYMNQLQLQSKPAIHNRSHISEQVYAPIYRRHLCSIMYPAVLNRLEIGAYRIPTVIVYLEPHSLMEPDLKANPGKDLSKELTLFEQILAFTHIPLIRLNTTTAGITAWRDPDDCVAEVEQALLDMDPQKYIARRIPQPH